MPLDTQLRPEIHSEDPDLVPRAPFYFLRAAVPGGFRADGWGMLAGWLGFQLLTSVVWAAHLRRLTGTSSLPTYWGEYLTARDLWEVWHHAGLKEHPFGVSLGLIAWGCLAWTLWCGWRMQARTVNLPPRILPWLLGALEAALLALLPLWLLRSVVMATLNLFASSGIQGLGWAHLVGTVLVTFAAGHFLMLQWWFCRLERLEIGLGWPQRLGHNFLRLWQHPIQWGLIASVGAILRLGLSGLALLAGWRLGGGSVKGVVLGLLALAGATALNAWVIGWELRLAALFWKHDRRVRLEVIRLRKG